MLSKRRSQNFLDIHRLDKLDRDDKKIEKTFTVLSNENNVNMPIQYQGNYLLANLRRFVSVVVDVVVLVVVDGRQ